MLVGLFLCVIPALLLTLVTYEETEISNKTCPFPECREYIADSLDMEMDFVPAQKRVTQIDIATASEGTEGELILDLYDGADLLHEEHLDIMSLGHYYTLSPVNWVLDKGHTYRLRLRSVDNDMPIHYYMFDGDVTLNDIGPGTVNGRATGNECLFGVVYWFRPYSRLRKLFMFITYYVISVLFFYCICANGFDYRNMKKLGEK